MSSCDKPKPDAFFDNLALINRHLFFFGQGVHDPHSPSQSAIRENIEPPSCFR